MPEAPRPADQYPLWATDVGAAIATPLAGRREMGFEENDEADESEFNWIQNRNGAWIQRLDAATLGPEIMGRAATWTESDFGFEAGAGLVHSFRPGVVWLDGRRCEFDSTYLAEIGEDSNTFAASSTTVLAIEPISRRLEYRVGGSASAGYTDVLEVDTDGSDITEVRYLIETAPESGGVINAPLRVSAAAFELNKGDASTLQFRYTVDGTTRWAWAHLGNEDLRLERYNSSGVSLRAEIGFPAAGGVSLHGRPSEVANAPAGADSVTIGQLGENAGASILFDTAGTLAWCRVAGTAAGSITVDSGDIMTIDCGGTAIEVNNADGALLPATDNDLLLGDTSHRWSACYAAAFEGSDYRGPGSQDMRLGSDSSIGNVIVRGDGTNGISAPWFMLQNHVGQASGAYDANSAKMGLRVGSTNTNGTEDIVLIGASDLLPSRAYYIEAKILGVENTDATDGYGRRQALIYQNTDSTSLAFGTTVEDSGGGGGYGGWPGATTAGLTIDGSNNIVLRVTAQNTVQRNWSVLVTLHDIDHAD